MAKLTINIDDELKEKSNELFKSLGMNMTTAIALYLTQCVMCDGIPFNIQRTKENQEE